MNSLDRPRTLEQIDASLSAWQLNIAQATDNILALYDTEPYKRLELVGARLAGYTQHRVGPALDAMRELFDQIGKLNDVVNHALAVRKSINRFLPSERALREIDELLNGPSIQLPPVHTPLAQRSLLSASDSVRATTPTELLQAMVAAFEEARDAVCAVGDAWEQLDNRLAPAEADLTSLTGLAQQLDQASLASLQELQSRVRALRDRVETDPLGASADFTGDIQPLVARARADVETLRAERDRLKKAQSDAAAVLDQLRTLHAASQSLLAECAQKVASSSGPTACLNDAQISQMADWLATLQSTASSPRWRAALVGLDRWNQTAAEYLRAEQAAQTANRALLDLRAEYRGRLSALKIKAQARGVAEDFLLTATARELDAVLGACPVPLDEAAAKLGSYELQLNTLLKRSV